MGDAGPGVLIVDDDSGVRQLLRLQLEMAGFTSISAPTAEEAVEILRNATIPIVITDINLPGMSGLELIGWVKQQGRSDVIAMTGYVNEYSYEQVVAKGAADFILKPIRAQELIMRLKRVVAERDLRQTRDKLLRDFQALAITDGLTGLFNSRHFHNQLDIEIGRANRYSRRLSLLLLDIDFFKQFNDGYGHLEGDKALIRIGEALRSCLRGVDSAYRYGGEEFTAILPETTCEEAQKVANRVRETVAQATLEPLPGKTVTVTVSIGATEYVANEDAKSFIRRADVALYAAKAGGRNRVVLEPPPKPVILTP